MIQVAQDIDQTCITTIRTLVMDAVQRANSGHPGSPMGMAPIAYCLWQQFLRIPWLIGGAADLAPSTKTRLTFDGTGDFSAQNYADPQAGKPDVLLLATGSEVALCLEAYEQLTAEGIKTRVVSMPSWELFELQSREYREHVLPPDVIARVSVEEASTFGWSQYVGPTGESIGMHTFGASAPLKELQRKFGFTPERVVVAAKAQLAS
jgi:transketolase